MNKKKLEKNLVSQCTYSVHVFIYLLNFQKITPLCQLINRDCD